MDRLTFTDRVLGWIGNAALKVTHKLTDPVLAAIFDWNTRAKKLTKPWAQLVIVRAAIDTKAMNIAQVPFRLHKGTAEGDVIESGPLYDLFQEINPTMDRFEFWESLSLSYDVGGNFYIWPDKAKDRNGVPAYLWVCPPHMVKEENRNGTFVGWRYARKQDTGGQGAFIPVGEMIHSKLYNPYNEIRGLSPLETAAQEMGIEWDVLRFTTRFFEKDATPSLVFETDKPMPEPKRRKIQHELVEKRQGVEFMHDALILSGGLKARTLTPSMKDMLLLEHMKVSDERILMILKVPKHEVDINEDYKYATALSKDRTFWTTSLLPRMRKMESAINKGFLHEFGVVGRFDVSTIEALTMMVLEKVDAAVKLSTIGFTGNEINARLQLGFEDKPWRDEPIKAAPPAAAPSDPGSKKAAPPLSIDDDEIVEGLEDERLRQLNNSVAGLVGKCSSALRKYFSEVEQRIFNGIISKGWRDPSVELKGNWDDLDEVIATAYSDERLVGIMGGYVEEAVTAGAETILPEFVLTNERVEFFLNFRLTKIKDINTRATVALKERLTGILQEATAAGSTEDETARAIMEGVRDQMTMDRTRARSIARTEMHGGFSDGRWEAMEETAPDKKKWISSRDSKVRASHQECHAQGAIPFGQVFLNGLMRPHDPYGGAEDVINCRCKLVALYAEQKSGAIPCTINGDISPITMWGVMV
jgi:HK97 family phage portal protein